MDGKAVALPKEQPHVLEKQGKKGIEETVERAGGYRRPKENVGDKSQIVPNGANKNRT